VNLKSEEKKVSIIVPVYNVETYLKECLNTILKQTYKNIEIILVNDGSTDKSGEICEQYKEKDNRVKVIHKSNGGAADARNVGIENSTGEWITFVDGDDYISDDLVEMLLTTAIKYTADIVISNLAGVRNFKQEVEINNKKIKVEELKSEEAIEEMLYQNKFDTGMPGKIFKKEFFNTYKFPVGNLYEDIAIMALLFNMAKKVIYTNYIGYMYYFRENGTTRGNFKIEKMELIDVCLDIKKFIDKNYPKIENAARYRLLNSAFHLVLKIHEGEYEKQEKELWEIIKANRKYVIKDKKVRKKTKIAIILSFFGKRNLKIIFEKTNKLTGKRI